ncbi:glycine/serine hydroxymethyltransferase [Kineococcus aurantiacus]|uniref:Glycine/serine hydroxymethyltransferase n=1 Tax=Kineococcus aurantiacus TaxID=37633 RepID=A0A7Y9DQA7_9ACTN|nr:hypothetical protein [Kineococcus aurantiacus]NYD24840.1 glycine/serine hydroxymethyltransferase [Kineococcus aurantiacus]
MTTAVQHGGRSRADGTVPGRPLAGAAPDVAAATASEPARRQSTLEMTASGDPEPRAVGEAPGSVLTTGFAEHWERALTGAELLAERLLARDSRAAGLDVVSGGTDVHVVLVDLRGSHLDGRQAEDRLHEIGIAVDRHPVPRDPATPGAGSGVRIGTRALAARGFAAADFAEVADVVAAALRPGTDHLARLALRGRVRALARRHPLHPDLTEADR